MLLKDMGAVIGEVEPMAGDDNAPTLNISIEDKRNTKD